MSRRAKDLAAALTAAVGAALLLLGLYLGEGEIVLRKGFGALYYVAGSTLGAKKVHRAHDMRKP